MKDSISSKILCGAFFFYVISSAYVKLHNKREFRDFLDVLIEVTPFDAFPLKYLTNEESRHFQMSVVSSQEVSQILETNELPREHKGDFFPASNVLPLHQDYLVIKLDISIKDRYSSDIRNYTDNVKCYFSGFPYSIYVTSRYPTNQISILPYPAFLKKQQGEYCDVHLR